MADNGEDDEVEFLGVLPGQPPPRPRRPRVGKAQPLNEKQLRVADETFRTNLKLHAGFEVAKIKADGNCYFSAVRDQLLRHEAQKAGVPSAHELRQAAVLYNSQHPPSDEEWAAFKIAHDEHAHQTFAQYCAHMKKSGTWATELEVTAMSRVLGRPLYVWSEGVFLTSPPHPPKPVVDMPQDMPALHVSYHAGNHYNSLYPMQPS